MEGNEPYRVQALQTTNKQEGKQTAATATTTSNGMFGLMGCLV